MQDYKQDSTYYSGLAKLIILSLNIIISQIVHKQSECFDIHGLLFIHS